MALFVLVAISMQKIVENLQTIQARLPTTCTLSNIKKLQSAFLEYQRLVIALPENYGELKKRHKNNFGLLQLKIDAIEDYSRSPKFARLCFKEAVDQLGTEIASVIFSVNGLKK